MYITNIIAIIIIVIIITINSVDRKGKGCVVVEQAPDAMFVSYRERWLQTQTGDIQRASLGKQKEAHDMKRLRSQLNIIS